MKLHLLVAFSVMLLIFPAQSSSAQPKPGKKVSYSLGYTSPASLLRVGPSFLVEDNRIGGIAQFAVGSFRPFMEVLLKSGAYSFNIGNNLQLMLHQKNTRIYGGIGGGLSGTIYNGGDSTRLRPLFQVLSGIDQKLNGKSGAFLQIQYLHTFDNRPLAVKGVSIQAGLSQGF